MMTSDNPYEPARVQRRRLGESVRLVYHGDEATVVPAPPVGRP